MWVLLKEFLIYRSISRVRITSNLKLGSQYDACMTCWQFDLCCNRLGIYFSVNVTFSECHIVNQALLCIIII